MPHFCQFREHISAYETLLKTVFPGISLVLLEIWQRGNTPLRRSWNQLRCVTVVTNAPLLVDAHLFASHAAANVVKLLVVWEVGWFELW